METTRIKDSFGKSNSNKKSGKKKTHAVFEEFPREESDSDENQLLTVEVRPNMVHRPIGSIPVADCVDGSVPSQVRNVADIFSVKNKVFFDMNGQNVPYEIDCDASVSTIASHWIHKLKLSIKTSDKVLRAYGNHDLHALGKVFAEVCYNGYNTLQCLYVVDSNNPNLCGRDLMPKFGTALTGLEEVVIVLSCSWKILQQIPVCQFLA